MEQQLSALTHEISALKARLRQVTLEKEIFLDTAHPLTMDELSECLFCGFSSDYLSMAVIRVHADPATRHHAPITSEELSNGNVDQRQLDIVYYPKESLAFVESLCQKYLAPEHCTVVFRAGRDIAVLLNPKAQYISASRVQHGNYASELKWKLSQLLLELDKHMEFQSIITLSSIAQKAVRLRQLYLENTYTYDYSWDCVGGVHSYQDLNAFPMSAKDLAELSILEQEFMDNVARTLYQGAATTLNSILQRQFQHTVPLYEITSAVTTRLRNVLAIIEYSSDFSKGCLAELTALVQQVSTSSSIPELLDRIQDFFSSLADFSPSQEAGKGDQILSFIQSNYKNPRLGAQMLCDRFRISRTYLSVLIKKATGQGLVDLLHSYRVEAAKDLLRGTRLNIEQIAQQVGFSNRYSLIRAFRTYTGTTPSEYRRSGQAQS